MSPEHTDDSTKPLDASRASVDEMFSREMSAAMDLAVRSGDLRSVLVEIVESVRRISQADEVWFVIHSDAVWGESLDFGDDDGPVRVEGDDFDRDWRTPSYMISPECYFSRPDIWSMRGSTGSPSDMAWLEGDWFKFPLWDETRRSTACLVVGCTSDGLLLDETDVTRIGLLAKAASLVIARKREHVHFERLSDSMRQRTYLLEDILTISSSLVSERSLENLCGMVLTSVCTMFGFERATLVIHDQEAGVFRWRALFGYPEEVMQRTLVRTIPPEAVLDELAPEHRISRSAYHVPFEKMPEASKMYFVTDATLEFALTAGPRRPGELREGDTLAFALHDSGGSIVGAVYPSIPRNGLLPDKESIETMEIFTSFVEVAMEEARLSAERESALRLSSQRAEQLSRIFELISELMYVRDLDHLLEDVLKTLAQLLGIKRMTVGVRDEERGTFVVQAVHGYEKANAEAIKRLEFPIERVDFMLDPYSHKITSSPVRWRKKIGRRTYYVPTEGSDFETSDSVYYPDMESIKRPRKSKDHWHALDYIDTFIFNREGVVVAYLEILKPRDDRVPDQEAIEVIEIFASIAGIAIENSRLFQDQVDDRQTAEFYTDLLSHDIKNFHQAITGYLDILRAHLPQQEQQAMADKIADQVMNVSRLANDVRTLSRLTWGGVSLARMDLGSVLIDCMNGVTMYHLSRKIELEHDLQPGRYFVSADELLRELFVNILTNAVKYDSHETVKISVAVERETEGTKGWFVVSISDHGRGIPDEFKEDIFTRFSTAPKKKGSSGLGLHLVQTLARRYGGSVSVEDRVKGSTEEGSVFRVRLPED